MSVQIIQERLAAYECKSTLEEEQALREITQEIILAGLSRTNFFEHGAFHGGTCLRIFHGLNRFSEDMDFASCNVNIDFKFAPYLKQVRTELSAYGYELEIDDRPKAERTVRQAFLKDNSIGKLLHLNYRPVTGPMKKLRIKLEIDINPPYGATYKMPIFDYPYPSAIKIFDLPSLFAGKLHALLCRNYLKGRDWYDFIWYTARSTPINHKLLSAALNQQGSWKNSDIRTDNSWCAKQLQSLIKTIEWEKAKQDVQRFVKSVELPSLKLWTSDFFCSQCQKLLSL